MKNPTKLSPLVYVELEVSYRWQGNEPVCAYCTVIEQRGTLHRRVVASVHIQGTGERLLDLVAAWYLEAQREHVLTHISPF
jgi:hypothetical protein